MEQYENFLRESLEKYKLRTIEFNRLLEFAAGNNANEARLIQIKTLDFYNFKKTIECLCEKQILEPYGKESYNGLKKNYRVVGNINNQKRDTEVMAKIMSYQFPNMLYYTRNHDEFFKDKKTIDMIYNYYMKEDKPFLTANELGVLIFNDEKAFEQSEKEKFKTEEVSTPAKMKIGYALQIVTKLKLNMTQHLNAYITIEPFFYHISKSFFEKRVRDILILENKDTYYTFYRSDRAKEYDMIIYGEGNKIISSFSLANDYDILTTDKIYYFGDIDPVGFSIYNNLKKTYSSYDISLNKQSYLSLIEIYKNKECPQIKNKKIAPYLLAAKQVIEEEFNQDHGEFLIQLFNEKRYIPQEAIAIIES